jgi:6-phosphogluconolactonase
MAEVVVLSDPEALAEAAAERVVGVLAAAVAGRGIAHVALTGGSTAVALYVRLATSARREALDWSRVELWWGDERCVPPDHAASCARLALDILLDIGDGGAGLPVPSERIHPFPVEAAIGEGLGAAWAAKTYAERLRARVPAGRDGLPVFDLVLLGMGADGHILSVFPGSAALAPGAPLAMAVPAPTHIEPHLPRLTLDPRVVTVARHVLVMCHGAVKAGRVAEVLEGPLDVARLPAQLARGDNAVWLLDAAAAAGLMGR